MGSFNLPRVHRGENGKFALALNLAPLAVAMSVPLNPLKVASLRENGVRNQFLPRLNLLQDYQEFQWIRK
jgi:hypothetical protein